MPLDTAINNIGEYYAAHYLESQFAKDIADKLKGWRDLGTRAVPRRLQALADTYFKAKSQALDFDVTTHRMHVAEGELASWHDRVLRALGYESDPGYLLLAAEKSALPVLVRVSRYGKSWLVVAETPFCLPEAALPSDWNSEDPLDELVPSGTAPDGTSTAKIPWGEAVARLLREEDSPRWVMLLSGSTINLFDRHSFAQGRWIGFDLDDAFGRKESSAFDAMAALLSKETLCPDGENTSVLHDTLETQSHKFTHGVSTKLQGAVRRAIEEVCNGWVDHRRAKKQSYTRLADAEPALPGGERDISAEHLRHEALVFVYRILFCLYAEARGGELGVLPINDDVYRLGYSLEALRDLADAGEMPVQAEHGSYYHSHLKRLFSLINRGFQPSRAVSSDNDGEPWAPVKPEQMKLFADGLAKPQQLRLDQVGRKIVEHDDGLSGAFVIRPLTATLFDPAATPLLDRADLPNVRLQRVIRALSLGTDEKGKTIGRINYAELGIVQLGAVYEGLLSYKGFFARENLVQVHRSLDKAARAQAATDEGKAEEGDEFEENGNELEEDVATAMPEIGTNGIKLIFDDEIPKDAQTWFVPESCTKDFQPGEIVVERRTRQPRVYVRGEFILHLNGMDRVNSASYYTPELLTRTLVREVLSERLKGFGPEDADRLLTLTICEPAMGSATFINEMCDQLADEYLRLKQAQTCLIIEPGRYEEERRRVKHYIATRNVYGVDLNPTAVELGGLSLWLGSMHRLLVRKGAGAEPDVYRVGAVPWFGLRLRTGNSLIGARRSVWTSDQLRDCAFFGEGSSVPRTLRPGEARADNEIYHFLVWDEDMVPAYRAGLMKLFCPKECKAGTDWTSKEVKKRWSEADVLAGKTISAAIDGLWAEYAKDRSCALELTACTATVWPSPAGSDEALSPGPSLQQQEDVRAKLERLSGAFQRVKLIMDTWCALFFWPLEKHAELPTRAAWLAGLKILTGVDVGTSESRAMLSIKLGLQADLGALFAATSGRLPDVDQLCQAMPCLLVGQDIATEQRFHHWELVFTELLGPDVSGFAKPSGIDLMVGNPPWIPAAWNDTPLLDEFSPKLGVMGAKATDYSQVRQTLLQPDDNRAKFQSFFQRGAGLAAFITNIRMYPFLKGIRANLYKNFIERSWTLLANYGIAGLLHPESVFDDPAAGTFRAAYYRRLRRKFQFWNELSFFPEVQHRMAFGIHVFSGLEDEVNFVAIFNLFRSETIELCRASELSNQPLPSLKTDGGDWATQGHPDRLVTISTRILQDLKRIFEEGNTPASHSRLPKIHGRQILSVLEKIGAIDVRLDSLADNYMPTEMFDEKNSQNDGVLTRTEHPSYQPMSPEDLVVSGPLVNLGAAWSKQARTVCRQKSDYDNVDWIAAPDAFLPRAVYRPGDKFGDNVRFRASIDEWPRPSLPGFWPIQENERENWESLCGAELVFYGEDDRTHGERASRRFAYFTVATDDVVDAIHWLARSAAPLERQELLRRFPHVKLHQGCPNTSDFLRLPRPLTSYYRHIHRRKGQPANARTLIPAILPPGPVHISSVFSIAFLDETTMLGFFGTCLSIVFDFLMRMSGKEDLRHEQLRMLPMVSGWRLPLIRGRALRLVCLTEHYSDLWERERGEIQNGDSWTSADSRFISAHELPWAALPSRWTRGCALRTDFARRQALIEIDVLVAQALNLTLNELLTIYRVQFPVMQIYETKDEYDSQGQRLPNTVRKDPGGKEMREARKTHDCAGPITATWKVDGRRSSVTNTFHPPFTRVDREEDYRRAWAAFAACFAAQ